MKYFLIASVMIGSISSNAADISISGKVSRVECTLRNGIYSGKLEFSTVTIQKAIYSINARVDATRGYDLYHLCEILKESTGSKRDSIITQLFLRCIGYQCTPAEIVGAVVARPNFSPIAKFKLP